VSLREISGGKMKLICTAFGVTTMLGAGLGARTMQTNDKSKVEVMGGKEVTISGCIQTNPNGDQPCLHYLGVTSVKMLSEACG
jgi:hypothetical protein